MPTCWLAREVHRTRENGFAHYYDGYLSDGFHPKSVLQHVGIFWCYLTLKFALAPTQNLKFELAPTPTPDTSQWNMVGVGPSGIGAGVGHVHFTFFV